MKFWRNNRLDAEFRLEPAQVVELVKHSKYWQQWPLESSLRAFMTDSAGPISAVWDDQDGFDETYRLARAAGRDPQ